MLRRRATLGQHRNDVRQKLPGLADKI
jgi:hypothetical protein